MLFSIERDNGKIIHLEEIASIEKLKTALEELFVLTAERYIFVDKPLPLHFARTKMIKQMITNTTSGWFNRFLIENFSELREVEHENTKNKGYRKWLEIQKIIQILIFVK